MKRSFYLPDLTNDMIDRLTRGLALYFKYSMKISYDKFKCTLDLELASMGRSLYPDESSQAEPHKLGRPVTEDSIRWDKISAYVNGFLQAVT